MASETLPDAVVRLVIARISSVEQLEVLLLLRAEPGVAKSAEEICATLRTSQASVASRLRDLEIHGLVTPKGDASPMRYQFNERSPELEAVAQLARYYATHRVTIIDTIFSRPNRMLRTLADAFRLKRGT